MSTVQAPHVPRSQTLLAPVRSKELRKASSSVTRGSSSALYLLPLIVSATGTFPGPSTAGSVPAAPASFVPTRGTEAAMPPIFRKSRRETPREEGLRPEFREVRLGLRPSSSPISRLRLYPPDRTNEARSPPGILVQSPAFPKPARSATGAAIYS